MKIALGILAMAVCVIASPASAQEYRKVAQQGEWTAECRDNRMTDKRDCRVTVHVSQDRYPIINGTLIVSDSGKSTFVVYPYPLIARLRVDKNKVIEVPCRTFCEFDGQVGKTLLKQMLTGSILLYSVGTVNGAIEPTELSLSGFREAYGLATSKR